MLFDNEFAVHSASGITVAIRRPLQKINQRKRGLQNGANFVRNETWIIAKLRNESIVTGISTLGYNDSNKEEWITDYMLLYSTAKEYLSFKETSGELKVRRVVISVCCNYSKLIWCCICIFSLYMNIWCHMCLVEVKRNIFSL